VKDAYYISVEIETTGPTSSRYPLLAIKDYMEKMKVE